MATYSLRPLTARQIRGRKSGWLLAFAVSLLVLMTTVAVWMNLCSCPTIRTVLFTLSIAAVPVAIFSGFGFWNFPNYLRLREGYAYEVSPQGVRRYTGLPIAGPEILTLGLNTPSETERAQHRQETRFFLPVASIRRMERAPNGGLSIRGRSGHGAIGVPHSLDGIERFRQELLDLGIPEVHRSASAWFLRRAGLWSAVALLLLATSYMFWGTHPWGILVAALLYAGAMAWPLLRARRAHEGRSAQSVVFPLVIAALLLIEAGARTWRLTHPHHSTRMAVPSSLR